MTSLKKLFNWELAWSVDVRRWYYQDRKSGEAHWKRPDGCKENGDHLDPPAEDKVPHGAVEGLPDGWEAHWDPVKSRHYFYNAGTKERTWFAPKVEKKEQLEKKKASMEPDEDAPERADTLSPEGFVEALNTKRASQRGSVAGERIIQGGGGASMVKRRSSIISPHARAAALAAISKPSQEGAAEKNDDPSGERMPHLPNNKDLAQLLWDAPSYSERLAENAKYPKVFRETLAEVKDGNDAYVKHKTMHIPETKMVTFEDCKEATLLGEADPYDTLPIVTISRKTVAEASAFFALDPKRVVVCLSPSSGKASTIGNGYTDGSADPEADVEGDLCRRIPNLYPSLLAAGQWGLYPFGPSTCKHPDEPEHYCSVLFTPNVEVDPSTGLQKTGCLIARAGLGRGFALYPRDVIPRRVGVVSAAAPVVGNKNRALNEIWDHRLMCNTISNIFMAPVLEQPRVTTLVLGAWGVSEKAAPETVGSLFGEAIVRGRQVGEGAEDEGQSSPTFVRLGRLYHEIHFALPPSASLDEKFYEAFLRGLTKTGCKVGSIAELDAMWA